MTTFQDLLNRFKDHEKFISGLLECNTDGDFSDNGEDYTPGMPEYLLDLQFISGSTNIHLQFEGDDLDDILTQAEDHINLIFVTSTM